MIPRIVLGALAAAGLLAVTPGAADAAPGPKSSPGEASFDWFAYGGADPSDQAFEAGRGQYANPILKGFYPDPSVTRMGEDYYLVNSTFSYFPGLPVFHSKDLVHWTQIANAIDRPGQLSFKGLRLSRGVFAPAITEHGGVLYILNTCVDCGGNFLITATDPKGPWSDPVWLPQIDGIDTSLFFDDDGRGWIVNNGPPDHAPLYQGHRAIWIQEYDPKARKMVGPRRVLVDGGVDPSTKPIWIEGPHITKVEGRYILTAAEGGTAEGHSQVALRSDRVTGPYLPFERNPILTQRGLPKDRPLPITSAGHADLVQTQNGEWWATFLAVRPYGDDLYNTGRETFLLPVTWKDGWPVILPAGQTIPYVHVKPNLPQQAAPALPTSGAFQVRDEFDGAELPLNWMTLRVPAERWWSLKGGRLVLKARDQKLGGLVQPSFWGRRQQHLNASASTAIRYVPTRPGDKAGMAVIQNDDFYYFLGLALEDGKTVVRLERRAGPQDPVDGVVLASAPIALKPGAPVYLKIDARGGAYDFSYGQTEGQWTTLKAGTDGTILSTKTAGGFVGALMGVYAYAAP
jgi:xylan 1,4-beta-xylosidase